MNLGDIVGQLMRDGLSPATQKRLQNAIGESGIGGLGSDGGIGEMLGSVLGGGATTSGAATGSDKGTLGGLLGSIGNVLSADSGVGGLSRGQVGGLGAIAGALLGGGGSSVKGAIGGSAMALLGTLAISALQNWQQQAAAGSGSALAGGLSESQINQIGAPETAELCLRGMIEAVKADGNVSAEEVQRVVGNLEEGGITPEEQKLVRHYMNRTPDVRGLVAAIPNSEVGAQVYAAALMAISVDTQAESDFLAQLAQGAGLDRQTVARLHAMVGAPPPAG
jgi:uncharacterized membrane protein YebE (DUF533 family)